MRATSAEDFIESLRNPRKNEGLFVVGMAKLTPEGHEAILLGPTYQCGPWTRIPVEAIEHVVPLQTSPCKDHEHPIVAIHFKDTGDPATAALCQFWRATEKALASQLLSQTRRQVAGEGGNGGPRPEFGAGGGPPPPGSCLLRQFTVCWEGASSLEDPHGPLRLYCHTIYLWVCF